MREHWPPDRVKEWDDAINEYFAIEEASKQPDRPSNEEWNTSIPELLVSPFTRKGLAQVDECLHAIAPMGNRRVRKVRSPRDDTDHAYRTRSRVVGFRPFTRIRQRRRNWR
jgi:hypothetical protein